MHLADAFIQSDLQCIQVIHLLSVCVFPGNVNWTHNQLFPLLVDILLLLLLTLLILLILIIIS